MKQEPADDNSTFSEALESLRQEEDNCRKEFEKVESEIKTDFLRLKRSAPKRQSG